MQLYRSIACRISIALARGGPVLAYSLILVTSLRTRVSYNIDKLT